MLVKSFAMLVTAAVLAASAPAFAVFTAPAWVGSADPAATAGRTFQQWDVFGSVAGPNAPLTNNVNPYGTANAFDSNAGTVASGHSGAFLTGGGNIYSFSGVIQPRAIVPLANIGGNVETFTVDLQVGAGSSTINTDLTVNGTAASTLAGYTFTDNTDVAASTQRYHYTFTIPDAASARLDWGWGAMSASLDVLAIETHSLAAPVGTPEPASLALLGVGGATLLRRRRR